MPNHLSLLGIIHTIISILAIFASLFALIRYGRISPATGAGKIYILLTVITCLTGLPIMKTGHLTAGHYLAILILVLLPIAIYARQLRVFGKGTEYAQVVLMSATLFFSFIPAIVETLTRLPVSHPLAASPASPDIKTGMLILTVLFITGIVYQVVQIRTKRKKAQAADVVV